MEQLRAYLESHKAADLAKALGVTKGYISQLKEGRATPSLRRAVQIEDATGGAVPARAWVE